MTSGKNRGTGSGRAATRKIERLRCPHAWATDVTRFGAAETWLLCFGCGSLVTA